MENEELKPALPTIKEAFDQAEGEEKKWMLAFNEATKVALNDRPSEPVDVAFFFGRSWFDAEAVYSLLVDLYISGSVKNIAIYGNEGQPFFGKKEKPLSEEDETMLKPSDKFPFSRLRKTVAPPREMARNRLIRMIKAANPDIKDEELEEHIVLTAIPDPEQNNTPQESLGFLRTAKGRRWKSGVVVANQHQLLREMLGLIKLMDGGEEYMDIWSVAPTPNWEKKVRGAQGEHFGPREEHILLEMGRVRIYQKLKDDGSLGDLASFERYYEYRTNRR